MSNKREKNFPLVKVVVFLAIVAILETLSQAIQPLIMTDISIKGQLADSDASYAGFKIYEQLTAYTPLAYAAIGLLIFRKELKNLFKKEKGENIDEEN